MRYCITCRFYDAPIHREGLPNRIPGHCENDTAIMASSVSPVDGRMTRAPFYAASDMRIHGPCGMDGKYWEKLMS